MKVPAKSLIPEDYLKPLSKKQRAFVIEYAESGAIVESYRKVYGDKGTFTAMAANKVARSPFVQQCLKAINQAVQDYLFWAKSESVLKLVEIIETAERDADKIAAIKELNKVLGFHAPEKVDVSHKGLTDFLDQVNRHIIEGGKIEDAEFLERLD